MSAKFHADDAAVEAATAIIQTHAHTSKKRARATALALFAAMGIEAPSPAPDKTERNPAINRYHLAIWAGLFLVLGVVIFHTVIKP